jgi:hypothetical protein
MKRSDLLPAFLAGAALWVFAVCPASAQQSDAPPGSPAATRTIDGLQLPAPDEPFSGKIERNALQSTLFWQPRIAPPDGAPNVLLIMTDDVGFGAPSTFGGVIPTPALDRIAEMGPALHEHALNGALLAHAGGPADRTQSPFGRLWRDRGTGNGLSRL